MPKKTRLSSANEVTYERNTKYHFEESFSSLGKTREHTRTFTKYQKNEILHQQESKCSGSSCNHRKIDPKEMKFEHKKPWVSKGRAVMQYGRVICLDCQSTASNKEVLRKTSKKGKQKKHISFF